MIKFMFEKGLPGRSAEKVARAQVLKEDLTMTQKWSRESNLNQNGLRGSSLAEQ